MQTSAEKIWAAAQEQLRSMLSADTFNLWCAPLRACGQDNHSLVLEVANDFCEVWLKDNYMGLLRDVVALASGRQLQIQFKVAAGPSISATTPAARQIVQPALHLRRGWPRQDASAPRHRPVCRRPQKGRAGGLSFFRKIHQRIH